LLDGVHDESSKHAGRARHPCAPVVKSRRAHATTVAVASPARDPPTVVTQQAKARFVIPAANQSSSEPRVASHIALVDLSAFYDGTDDDARKAQAADAMRTSWAKSGTFLVAVDHEDKPKLRAAVAAAKAFFARPQHEKEAINHTPSHLAKIDTVVRGYVGNNSESAAALAGRPRASPDQAEKFSFRTENVSYGQIMHALENTFGDIDAFELERAIMRPNRFPPDRAGEEMRQALQAYSEVVSKLTDATLRACALAMGQDEYDILRRFCPGAENNIAPVNCRVLSYPPAPAGPTGDHRTGAHTDGGILTLVYRPDDTEAHGLQIIQDGAWANVPTTGDDALVVHPGDVLEWLSDGLFPALWHRVPAPPAGAPARMSFPSFVLPTMDFALSDLGPGEHYKLGDMRYSGWAKSKFEAIANGRRPEADEFDGSTLLPEADVH